MKTLEKVWVLYDEMFCDELSIKLLYQHKDFINEFVDENENPISKSAVADWIMENYYNDRKFVEYCKEGKGKILETAEQLYQYNEEYRKSVDEERLYLLYMIGIAVTKVANTFGVSRQTVYSRIKTLKKTDCRNFYRMAERLDTLSFFYLTVSLKNYVGGVLLLYLQYIMGSDEYTPILKLTK